MTRLYRLAAISMILAFALIVIGGVARVAHTSSIVDDFAGLTTGALAVCSFAIAIGAQLLPGVRMRVRSLSLLAVGLVLAQAAFGTSITGDTDRPAASALTLSLAMLLLAITFGTARLLEFDRHQPGAQRSWAPSDLSADRVFAWIAGVGTIAVTVVMATGGAARTAASTVACGAWPGCQSGSLVPGGASSSDWSNFTHRFAALAATIAIGALVLYGRRHQVEAQARRGAEIALLATLLQVVIGGVYVFSNGADWISALHLSASSLALVALVYALLMALRPMMSAGPDLAFAGVSRPSIANRSTPGGMPMLRMAVNAGDDSITGTVTSAQATAVEADALAPSGALAVVRSYVELMKPGILTLLLVTTLCAMLAAEEGVPSLSLVLCTMIGGTLIAGGANVLNCYIDRDIDKQMHRTKKRGTATGAIPANNALIFGLSISVIAILMIGFGANWLAAGLALAGNIFYVGIYTAYLKRRTPNNIVIGGAAGAFPPLVGWAAVTGDLSIAAFIMFAIIYYWTPPHFWALALLKQGEYGRASVPMLPVVAGENETQRQIFLYTVLLTAVSLLLAPFGFSWIYLFSAIFLCGIFLAYAAQLLIRPSKALARQTFFWSMWFLFLLFGAMVADRLILG
jgi:protoheme IX farnesyltransferase